MSTKLKTVFFGTHQFGQKILESLIGDPRIEVALVITQPDKPVGRKKVMTASPVKQFAESKGINVETPQSLKKYKLPEQFDIGVTAQYGLLVPEHILNAPTHGVLNVHTSLLPKYRGASPIQSALMNGETKTGVTIMKMDKGLDTGDILMQKEVAIDPNDTYPELDAKLADVAANILIGTIAGYVDGSIIPKPQDDSLATHCGLLSREDGVIDWNKSATEIYNQYRGLTPWPGISTSWNDKALKLLRIAPSDKHLSAGHVSYEDKKLYIGAGNGSIEVLELQLAGSKPMNASSFINGNQSFSHETLV